MRMADAREPGTGVFAAFLPRQQQFQRQRQRHRLAQRIDQDPHRQAVVTDDEERHAGEAQSSDRNGRAPRNRLAVKPLDAHRGKAGGENQHGAAGQQWRPRIRNKVQHRHRSTTGRGERRGGPEPRGLEGGIAAHDVGPDQAEREKIDDEHRPQRRNAQHRSPRARFALPLLLSNSPPITIPMVDSNMRPRRLTDSHCEWRNPNCGFESMNSEGRAGRRCMLAGQPATTLSRASPRQG